MQPSETAMPPHRAPTLPQFTPVPSMSADQVTPDRWPLRTYLELGALDSAPGSARAHAGAVLWEWGQDSIADDVCLIVSELITNAVGATRAARRPDPVRMWMLAGNGAGVLILIWDATMPAPVLGVTTPDAEHGRGLTIVDALSDRWGYFSGGQLGGKVVWATLAGPALPAKRIPVSPVANGERARNRAPIPPEILARVKAALERLPAPAR
jgi:anti-sigma regulatory factor (Ser/Thr protein kinase)